MPGFNLLIRLQSAARLFLLAIRVIPTLKTVRQTPSADKRHKQDGKRDPDARKPAPHPKPSHGNVQCCGAMIMVLVIGFIR